MELYLDTSDVAAVKKLARIFPLAGVTTNPSIVAAGKTPLDELLPALHDALGGKGRLFAQVMATTAEGMVEDARKLRAIINDLVVKVPVTAEAAYDRRMYRYKAHYSLDCDNGIENAILMKPQTPEMFLEEKQLREQLYAAVMALPEKQAKRIYARYYLGMRVSEIAAAEGVDPSRVRDSIRRGLKQLAKYF